MRTLVDEVPVGALARVEDAGSHASGDSPAPQAKPLSFQLLESLHRAMHTASAAMNDEVTEARKALSGHAAAMHELGVVMLAVPTPSGVVAGAGVGVGSGGELFVGCFNQTSIGDALAALHQAFTHLA
jgi:hypothetical protein